MNEQVGERGTGYREGIVGTFLVALMLFTFLFPLLRKRGGGVAARAAGPRGGIGAFFRAGDDGTGPRSLPDPDRRRGRVDFLIRGMAQGEPLMDDRPQTGSIRLRRRKPSDLSAEALAKAEASKPRQYGRGGE